MRIDISSLIALTHLLVDRRQHIISSTPTWIKREHLVRHRKGFVITAHIEIQADQFSITRSIARLFVYAVFLIHKTAQLIIDTLTHIAQIISGSGIIGIQNESLAIGLHGILIEILRAVSITNTEVELI